MSYRFRNPELSQEEDDVPASKVLLAIAVTLLISAVLVVWAVSAAAGNETEVRPSRAFPERWLGPRHMVALVREDVFGEQRGRSFNARQRAALEGYGWVDPARGLVHVPIERAIDLLLSGRRP
jgi:hypothetical protein